MRVFVLAAAAFVIATGTLLFSVGDFRVLQLSGLRSKPPHYTPQGLALSEKIKDVAMPEGISEGSINMGNIPSIPYLHCGPNYSSEENDGAESMPKELLLLHGMKFTKETWVEANILQSLCQLDKTLSVTAVDFPAVSNWSVLKQLFQGLTEAKVISGKALFIVSPSASGKSVLGLLDASIKDSTIAQEVMKGWIPVACGNIKQTSEEAINQIDVLNLPVLAIYGNDDKMGQVVSQTLKDIGGSNVNVMEMIGGHPVYLDETEKFIDAVISFVDEVSSSN